VNNQPYDPFLPRATKHERLQRGMFLLPSLFTMVSVAAGFYSITETIKAIADSGNAAFHLDLAAIAIIIAIPFDALDGRIARMTHTTTEFGRELDSLADAITFGVAPSLLALIWGFHFLPNTMNSHLHQHLMQVGAFVCFLFLVGGISRLARFNISHDAQPRNPGRPGRKYFVGMPIPAAAGIIASTVHFFNAYPVQEWWVALCWLILVGVCGYLMVSTWRFWSAKEINLTSRRPFQLFFVLMTVLYVVVRYSQGVMFAIGMVYMFSGIWARAAYSWSRRRRQRMSAVPPAATAAASGTTAAPGKRSDAPSDSARDAWTGA
jgi:CDP-diacylglycerol---serine O-phosphatidyltransferase